VPSTYRRGGRAGRRNDDREGWTTVSAQRGLIPDETWLRDTPGTVPSPRGVLSAGVARYLTGSDVPTPFGEPPAVSDPLGDDDLHLALYLCYELAYRGLAGVDDRLESDPALLTFRLQLEEAFEGALRKFVRPVDVRPDSVASELRAIAAMGEGPSLSGFMEREATLEQFEEFMIHRSIYHLKEADPHSFGIPRLAGAAKAALIEIQNDEYGDGDPSQMHSTLFGRSMEAMGLNPTYGWYLPRIPGATLALTNLMSLFGLHRRLRGALVGHLALFELTSSIPNRRYANGLRRCGLGCEATRFFDVHVEADAVHGAIAANDLAEGFVGGDAERAREVLFGALALQLLETTVGKSWMEDWGRGRTTLRS
jgi:hypothetical protein